ncbi:signal peptide peptidase SppA [Deinococcus ruber]|uniref:Peptidase n=1 Tax=Deinococcus ruber TaxID=1848197 RepID=A0A918F246_9DEIO|nr:signal peptide peptidase SppA [Deinococcus ruber]GGQ97850.1 peptidase [Deinococcus ruber]
MNIPFLKSDGNALPGGVTRPTWIVLDIAGEYPALSPGNPLAALLNRQDTQEALLARLERLQHADWLHGVLFRFGSFTAGLSTSRTLRDAFARLSETKRTIAYLPTLSMPALLAASGTREIVAPESAEVNLLGLGLEVMYLGEFLKKHGIGFENLRIREYKSALTRFSDDRMDDFNREQLGVLLDSMEAAWVKDLAEKRGLDEAAVRGWLDQPLSSAAAARDAGLLDRVAYEDELIGPATRPVTAVLDLLRPPRRPAGGSDAGRIAIVPVVGTIVTGKSQRNPLPLFGGVSAGSDTVVAALRRAAEDKKTKAVVLYVDSGGGSALASDLIWREVQQLQKPVVAVMGRVAASGGYYVLAAANTVLASPYTITGSIGVVSGKPVLEEFNRRQGLNPEGVSRHDTALMYSSARAFNDTQRHLVERSIEEVYQRFITRVADGRGMTPERVNELGRGRIWSGQDALALGLIDELGDLHTAVQRACELSGLPYGAPTWTAGPKNRGPLPEFAQEAADEAASLHLTAGLPSGQVMLWLDSDLHIR